MSRRRGCSRCWRRRGGAPSPGTRRSSSLLRRARSSSSHWVGARRSFARPGTSHCASSEPCGSPGCGACSPGSTRKRSVRSSAAFPESCCSNAAERRPLPFPLPFHRSPGGNARMRRCHLIAAGLAAGTACARPAPPADGPGVGGPGSAQPAGPAPDVVVTLNDYDFQFARPLPAGRRTIRVENAGPQAHEIVITALPPGKTLQDFVAWEKGGEKGPLPTGRWLGGVATLDAGAHAQFTATFQPGNYLLLCFWPDAKDGQPHLVHGMAKQITVT